MNLLREARTAAGLTQAEIARRAMVPQSTVARAEAADANPRLRTLERLLRACEHRLAAEPAVAPSIDETLVAQRLRLGIGERVAAFEHNHGAVDVLRGIAAR